MAKQLICEGAAGAFLPEVAYVKQGSKVLFFFGKPDMLTESLGTGTQVVESLQELELEERVINGQAVKHPKGGAWTVEGPYQRSGVTNANKRKYSPKIWEKQVGDPKSPVQLQIQQVGGLLGHLEHPADGRTHGKEGAIATRSLKLREDGVVWGRSDVLDTPNGLILQEYTKKGLRWGVSSRGRGEVNSAGDVSEDYELETFDAVMRPSTPGAYPELTMDAKKKQEGQSESVLSEEAKACEASVKSVCERTLDGLDEEAANKFLGEIMKLRGQVDSLSSEAMPKQRADELKDWLAKKLREVQEFSPSNLEEAIEEAMKEYESSEADSARDEAFRRIVSTFERRIATVVREAEELRQKLEKAEEEIVETTAMVEEMREERDASLELVTEMQTHLDEVTVQLDTAQAVLASDSEVEVENLVSEAVEDAIQQVPELGEYRDVLEAADAPGEVSALVEDLLPEVVAARRAPKPSEPRPGSRFPIPNKIVESAVKGGISLPSNPSRGAKMVGAMLKSRATDGPAST